MTPKIVNVSIDWFWLPIFHTNWDVRDDELFLAFILRLRVASPKGEALLCDPKGGFWPEIFQKKISPGLHISIQ